VGNGLGQIGSVPPVTAEKLPGFDAISSSLAGYLP